MKPRNLTGTAEDSAHNTNGAKAAMTKDPEMGGAPAPERKAGGVMGLHGSSARLTEIVPSGEPATPCRPATSRALRTSGQYTLAYVSPTKETLQLDALQPASRSVWCLNSRALLASADKWWHAGGHIATIIATPAGAHAPAAHQALTALRAMRILHAAGTVILRQVAIALCRGCCASKARR